MKNPDKRVWIGGQWVEIVERLDLGHFGEFNCFPKPEIVMGPVRKDVAAMTMIHEMLEAACEVLDIKMKESEIRCLEHCISALIVRSPNTVDWIISELRNSEKACGPNNPGVE